MTETIIYQTKKFHIEAPHLPPYETKQLYLTDQFNIFIHLHSATNEHHIIYYQHELAQTKFLLKLEPNSEQLLLDEFIPVQLFSNTTLSLSEIRLTLTLSLSDYHLIHNTIHTCPLHLHYIK